MRLPDGYRTTRPTLADVVEIGTLVDAVYLVAVGFPDFPESEVVAALTAPGFDPAKDSWLVWDGTDRLVGWAYLDQPASSTGPRALTRSRCSARSTPGRAKTQRSRRNSPRRSSTGSPNARRRAVDPG